MLPAQEAVRELPHRVRRGAAQAPDPWRVGSSEPVRRTATRLAPVRPAQLMPLDETGDPQPRPDHRGEPGRQLDLEVRLHTPLPQVVTVRVIGAGSGGPGVALPAERIAQRLRRAAHVVLGLGEVALLGCHGVDMLLDLHRDASAHGARLHITGADHMAVRDPLRLAGLDRVLTLAPSADELIALLPRTSGGAGGDAVVAGVRW